MEIRLRALEPEDLDALYDFENDRTEWINGSNNAPFSHYALRDYISHNAYDIYADKQLRQIIDVDGNVAGLIDLSDFDPRNLRAEVGIIVKADQRRNGIASDAITQIIDYARNILHLHQLYAIVPEKNEASVGLFRKLRFSHTATLKDWLTDCDNGQDALFFQLIL